MYSKTKLVANEEVLKPDFSTKSHNSAFDIWFNKGSQISDLLKLERFELLDYDGPEGFQYHFGSITGGASWTAYMSEQTLACTFKLLIFDLIKDPKFLIY